MNFGLARIGAWCAWLIRRRSGENGAGTDGVTGDRSVGVTGPGGWWLLAKLESREVVCSW